MKNYARKIRPHVSQELRCAFAAEARGHADEAFSRLERAHILGQASTVEHVRVHWQMFLWGLRQRKLRECAGQVLRMIGAASKTAIGWVPQGNTGGSNVSPFKPMPVPADLQDRIRAARS